MAYLFGHGYGMYDTAGEADNGWWTSDSNGAILQDDTGRRDNEKYFRMNDGNGTHVFDLDTAETGTIIMGAAIRTLSTIGQLDSTGGYNEVFRIRDTTLTLNEQDLCLLEYHNSIGYWRIRRGFSTASHEVVAERRITTELYRGWHFLELKFTLGSGAGVIQVRLNEEEIFNLSGIDTDLHTSSGVDQVAWDSHGGSDTHYDDHYLLDGTGGANDDFLGDHHFWIRVPTSDGNRTEYTAAGSPGSNNWDRVNETDPVTANYVESSTNGHDDLYGHSALDSEVGNVKAVVTYAYAQESAGSGSADVNFLARASGGTEAAGPLKGDQTLTTTSAYYWDIYEDEPGGTGWTDTQVDNAEFGHTVANIS